MSFWLTILLAGLLTFAIRLSFIVLHGRIHLPRWFQMALGYVPVAVLSAIIVPQSVSRNGVVDVSFRNPQLLSGLVAVLIAWRTRSVVLTIVAGMAAMLAFQMLMGAAGS